MKLYMKSVYDIRSQKPLRHTHWSLLLGILQTGMGLHRKTFFFLKVLILYTVAKLIENWTKNIKWGGFENGLVTSYSCSKSLKQSGKITILIPGFSWKCPCCKESNCIHLKLLTFYIKCIWNKTNSRNSWDPKALSKNLKCKFFHSAKKQSEL